MSVVTLDVKGWIWDCEREMSRDRWRCVGMAPGDDFFSRLEFIAGPRVAALTVNRKAKSGLARALEERMAKWTSE